MSEIRTLYDLVESFSSRGDADCLVHLQQEGVRSVSYRDLSRAVQQTARGLRSMGVREGDRLGLLSEVRFEAILALLAAVYAGAVIVPIDVQMGRKNLNRILQDCDPRLIFTTRQYRDKLENAESAASVVLLDESNPKEGLGGLQTDEGELPAAPKSEDAAILFYTSGTTGPPKGVPLSHGNIAYQLNIVRKTGLLTEEDRALLPLPLHHVYPLVIGVFVPLSLGISIVVPRSLTGPQVARAIREGKATVVIGVPRLYGALVNGIRTRLRSGSRVASALFSGLLQGSILARKHLGVYLGKRVFSFLHRRFGPQLRIVASGGSPLDPELAWRLEGLGWKVAIGYGLTETSPLLTINPPGHARIGTVGKVIEFTELRIDGEGEEQGMGGEILVRGPGVFSGYYHLPDKTEEAFSEGGWFRTGDLGYLDDDGYLVITGRASTLIVTEGGENVQPDEVEDTLSEHSLIKEAGVLEREGKLVALLVPDPGGIRREDKDDLHTAMRKAVQEQSGRMPSYQRIADFAITRESIPRTRLGKIRRHLLEERFTEAKEGEKHPGRVETGPIPMDRMSDQDQALLENDAARETWNWLADRYPEQRLTPDASPQLDLGVDSMEWLNITMEIRQRTGVEVTEEAIGRIETVRDLLQEIAEQSEEGRTDSQELSLENPEEGLTEYQMRWLRPQNRLQSGLAHGLIAVNRVLVRLYLQVEVQGEENLPSDEQVVFTPNHVSYLDPFVLASVLRTRRLRNSFWAGWTGAAFHNPLNRFVSRLAHTVPIDPQKGVFSSLAFAGAVLKRGKNLIWFPEGGRSHSGRLQPFKPGIGIILEKFPVKACPVFIAGTERAMPWGAGFPKPVKVRVRFGKPVSPEQLQETGSGENPRDRIVQGLYSRVVEMARAEGRVLEGEES